jgi:iron complex transport system substrate-binding protein
VLIDGSLANTPKTLRALGALLGEQSSADALAKYAESALARTQAALAQQPADGKLLVYYGRGKDGLEAGGGSINTEFLATVGARNVAGNEGKGGLTKVTIDQIAGWKPYVILTLDATFAQAALTDPAWSEVTAAKEKRVYRSPVLPFCWIDSPPGLNRLIGRDWLVQTLYPQQAKVDLREQAREFYHLFYHVDLSDEQLTTLLDGAVAKWTS